MAVIYRKYGKIAEITSIEKTFVKVRVHVARQRNPVYQTRRYDSLRRSQQICVRRVSSALEAFGRPLFVTLTFDGCASDAAYASDSIRGFQVRLQRQFKDAQSIFVPELSPRGRIHYHGLIFQVPLCYGDSREGKRRVPNGQERRDRTFAKLWGVGFVDCLQTDGSSRLAGYLAKYILKGSYGTGGASNIIFNGSKLIRISQGFPREIVIRGSLALDLQDYYSYKVPSHVWSTEQHQFLGRIERKTYTHE